MLLFDGSVAAADVAQWATIAANPVMLALVFFRLGVLEGKVKTITDRKETRADVESKPQVSAVFWEP